MSSQELYEATRGWWVVGERRKNVKLAFAVFDGVVREVYVVDEWQPVSAVTSLDISVRVAKTLSGT